MKILTALLLTTLTLQLKAQNKPTPPLPPTAAIRACIKTNVTVEANGAVSLYHVSITTNDCPSVWYYGLTANGEQRQWAVHNHDVPRFEADQFESGITMLWRTTYYVPDIAVIRVNKAPVPERDWRMPLTNSIPNVTVAK